MERSLTGPIIMANEKEYPTPEFKEWWDNAKPIKWFKCPSCNRLRSFEGKLVVVICKNCQVEMEEVG